MNSFAQAICRAARALGPSLCAAITILTAAVTPNLAQAWQPGDAWTDEQHPSYISRLTNFGERPDWSLDGKRVLFVGRTFGDVYEAEVESGELYPLTHHYYHGGYTRALYLWNGDVLLSGPTDFDPEDWQEGRFRKCELWILSKDGDAAPARLGRYCWEGPCASRTKPRIAWATHQGVYPERIGLYQIWVADIEYEDGNPRLVNQRVVVDNTKPPLKGAVLEPQNFRLPDEEELIFQSSHGGTEAMGIHLETGELTNYSQAPDSYDEPEGIFPDGNHTLVESNRHDDETRGGMLDLYKLKLDGSQEWERLTWFNAEGKHKATNPVISDDGRYMAFMVPRLRDVAGVGHGIYIYDLKKAEDATPPQD